MSTRIIIIIGSAVSASLGAFLASKMTKQSKVDKKRLEMFDLYSNILERIEPTRDREIMEFLCLEHVISKLISNTTSIEVLDAIEMILKCYDETMLKKEIEEIIEGGQSND